MKKVIVFILSLFMLIKVNALTYYSDYNKEGITDIPISSTDLVEVEEELKYEMYEEEINYVYLKNSDLELTGNFITSYTDWTTNIYDLNLDEEIETYYEYSYRPAKNYNYLSIKSVSGDITYEDLEIYDTQNNIYIYKGHLDTIFRNSSIIFRLTNQTNLANIKIKIKTYNDEEAILDIYASDEFPSLCTPEYITTLKDKLEIDDFSVYQNIYTNVDTYVIEEFKTEPQRDNYYLMNTYYRNRAVYREYKQVIRNYLGTYSNNPNDNIDYEKPKTFYKYRIRDKVVINDEYTSADNIILYSTLNNLQVLEDEDKIYIDIPFLEETVEFDKKEEPIDSSNYILVDPYELNSLYDELDNAYYLVDKKNLEIKEMILQSDEFTDSVVNDLNNCYTEKNILKDQKKTLKEEKEVKKGSIFYIFIILLLSVFLGMCRFMSTKKNN